MALYKCIIIVIIIANVMVAWHQPCVYMQDAAAEVGPAGVRSVITTQLTGHDS